MIIIGLVLFFVTFFVIWWAKNNTEGCGIDVFTWLQVFLSIATLGTLILCPILCCMRANHPLTAITTILVLTCLLTIALAAWVIYGYVIYFSDDNDCQKMYDTSIALVFMCIFLICGLCTIASAAVLLVAVPWIYFGAILPMQQENA